MPRDQNQPTMINGSAKNNETFGLSADADVSGSLFHVLGGNWAVNIFTVLKDDQMQYLNTDCIDPAFAPIFYSPDHLLHNATETETSMHAALHPGRFTSRCLRPLDLG
jgi:hypothetical protein